MSLRWLVVLAPAAFTACGAAPDAAPTATVRDSAGVRIVENTGAGWDAGAAWRISDEPLLVLGAAGSDPAAEFGRISGATRLSDGRTVVVEGMTQEVRYFGPDGEHLLTAGGEGQGPGEVRIADGLTRLSGDTVAVRDGATLKEVVFAPTGAVAREIPPPDREAVRALDGAYSCYFGRRFPDGSRTACVSEPGGPETVRVEGGMTHIGPGLVRPMERWVWIRPDLGASDTLGLNGGIEQFGAEVGRITPYYLVHPFYSRTRVAVQMVPPRFVVAVNPAYSIEVWAPGGRLERIIRKPDGARVPSEGLRAAAWAAMEEQEARHPDTEQRWNRGRDQLIVPDTLPAVHGLTLDAEGNLWVQRTHYLEEGPWIHDVFDGEGRYLGPVALPPRFQVLEIGADYVLGFRLDELDVPLVETYALEKG